MNPTYTRLTEGFKEWLHIIGYAPSTIDSLPRRTAELLEYVQTQGINSLSQVQSQHIRAYYELLKIKKSSQTGKLLRNSTLNGIIRAWRLFAHYLEETDQGTLNVDIPYEIDESVEREILTTSEIIALYNAADETILGLRDRAILSVYYGCGLRSNEGLNLNLSDVMVEKGLLYVRKGKGYKERYVPFTESLKTDFRLYLQECRPKLVKDRPEEAFLVNNQGKRIGSSTQTKRLKELLKQTNITKPIGLHNLRHSIATHLLKSGMQIEDIAKFLGHAYISSTQIYTHIAHEYEGL
ncbi:MAG: tyrosine-type recombinase/integrase [Bacteroidales bacterium]